MKENMPIVSTITLPAIIPASKTGDLASVLELLELAGADSPDIICLPEACAQLSNAWDSKTPQKIDGPIIKAISQKANEFNCYIVCPILLQENGKIYNSAILIDRKGNYIGRYDKNHLAPGEEKLGIIAGKNVPVFETDFGRIGVVICFDLNFSELGHILKSNGCEIIFFVSAFDGGLWLQNWAIQFQCYVISAVSNGIGKVINPLGQILCQSSLHKPVVSMRINLNYRICHLASILEKIVELKKRYRQSITIDIATPEARAMISYDDKSSSIEKILNEFDIPLIEEYLRK